MPFSCIWDQTIYPTVSARVVIDILERVIFDIQEWLGAPSTTVTLRDEKDEATTTNQQDMMADNPNRRQQRHVFN
jgi:hypothetical protein